MDCEVLAEVRVPHILLDPGLCPLVPLRRHHLVGRIERWPVEIEQSDSSDDVAPRLASQVESNLLGDVVTIVTPAIEADDLDAHLLGKLRIQPALQEVG